MNGRLWTIDQTGFAKYATTYSNFCWMWWDIASEYTSNWFRDYFWEVYK